MKKIAFLLISLLTLTFPILGQLAVVSDGNVGIGTNSPTNLQGFHRVLDIRGTNHSKIIASTTNATYRTGLFAHDDWYGGCGLVGTESNHNLHLATNLDPKLTILTNGNVGINNTSPNERLHINGSIRGDQSTGAIKIQTTADYTSVGPYNTSFAHFFTDRPRFYFGSDVMVNGAFAAYHSQNLYIRTYYTNRITILSSNGYVGIGTTSPSYMLDVNGDIATYGQLKITSDERLKKEISNLDAQKINNLYNLEAKTYIKDYSLLEIKERALSLPGDTTSIEVVDYKIDTMPKIGFIAQELKEYYPYLVTQDSKGFYSIDYISLIPVLVEALKEQQLVIEQLNLKVSRIMTELEKSR